MITVVIILVALAGKKWTRGFKMKLHLRKQIELCGIVMSAGKSH